MGGCEIGPTFVPALERAEPDYLSGYIPMRAAVAALENPQLLRIAIGLGPDDYIKVSSVHDTEPGGSEEYSFRGTVTGGHGADVFVFDDEMGGRSKIYLIL